MTVNRDPAERPQENSSPERRERILALEELHEMAVLNGDEFVIEITRVTAP